MKNNNSHGDDQTRLFTPLNVKPSNPDGKNAAPSRQEQNNGQRQTYTDRYRRGQNADRTGSDQLRRGQRTISGQGQSRSAGGGQNPAGQSHRRSPAQNSTKPTGQIKRQSEVLERTKSMQTVQGGEPDNRNNTGNMKTIYKKEIPAQKTTVINKVNPNTRTTAGQTRIMNAVVPVNRQDARRNVSAAPYRKENHKSAMLRKPPKKSYNEEGGEVVTGALTSVMKAVIYIVFVLVVSGFLSYFGISICNDVFAFIKSDDEKEIIIPEYATLGDIADILKENDIISYPSVFKLYAKLRRDSGEYLSGVYTVSPAMNYDMLLSDFKPKPKPREEVSITIPEGFSVDQIIEIFVKKDMGTRERFIDVIENGDFSEYNLNWFIDEIEKNKSPDRKYRLEGYLFPDTYYFYTDSSEYTIIYKLLRNFYNKFDESYKDRCAELNYTVDQIITLASMIQAEAKYASEYTLISSVFHNRLNDPNGPTQGRLESDPTVQYFLDEHKSILTQAETNIKHPYNTYIHKGLPPGPICNPSLNAIQYALYPSDTDYLFFVAKRDGYHRFAVTYDEHIMNKLTVD